MIWEGICTDVSENARTMSKIRARVCGRPAAVSTEPQPRPAITPYGSEGPPWWRDGSANIRHGYHTWQDLCEADDLRNYEMAALFDMHDVVGTMSYDEAAHVGVALDHVDGLCPLLCFYGRPHRR